MTWPESHNLMGFWPHVAPTSHVFMGTPPHLEVAAENTAAGWCGGGGDLDGTFRLASHEKVGLAIHPRPESHEFVGWPPTSAAHENMGLPPTWMPESHGFLGHSKKPSAGLRYRLVVRMAKRPQVVVVVGATTMQRHDMVNLEAPVVWRRHHTTTIAFDDSSRLLLPFPTAGCTPGTISEGALVAARTRGQQRVAVEAASTHSSCAHCHHRMPNPRPIQSPELKASTKSSDVIEPLLRLPR